MNRIYKIILAGVLSLLSLNASAQYYSNGQSPASQKWGQIRTDSLRMIYPLEFEDNARRTLYYMDTVRPWVSHGFRHAPLKTPVVMTTENFYSNGLGILAPKRIEMAGLPATDTYATPWLKQLAAHEYRHMVQYSNINRSTVKGLGYVFGQQLPLLCTGVLPFWLLEGDAVMTETQFSEFGRALQPSFTMHYRAAAEELTARRNPDKWFVGSYKDYVPSHYELGYQLVAHSERLYDEYIWDDVARYGANFPFLLFTTQLSLHKYHKTSTKELFHETFGYLNEYWASLPERENSANIVATPEKRYTTYRHPLYINDSTILALKSDYDRAQRFVLIDLSDNSERIVCHTGHVSSRPEYKNGMVVWTEYRPTHWEQRTDSKICYMYEGEWKPRTVCGERAALYPVVMPDGEISYIDYHYDGTYWLVDGRGHKYFFAAGTSVHGLAFDETTDTFYFIALEDEGMWIGSLNGTESKRVTPPSRITIRDLRAESGKLYFGSIESGYDEVHTIDLVTGTESRLSTSKYGSFSPAPSPDSKHIALTVYERDGYKAAVQEAVAAEIVAPAHLPHNVVNPPTADWGLPNIDQITFTEADLEESYNEKPAKRYRKASHLFNFHSWAPVNFDGEDFIRNFDFNNITLGVSAISQNLLSSAITSLGYGYTSSGNSLVRARFRYMGWLPKIDINAQWSNRGQPIRLINSENPPAVGSSYYYVNTRVYMPLMLSSGYRIRQITPQIQYMYRNSVALNPQTLEYDTGEHLVAASLGYSMNVRRASLDLIPRWGALLRATMITEPGKNRIYTNTAGVYGRIYTPGIVRHHGLSLAAAYQQSFGRKGYRPYGVLDLLPRGSANIVPEKMMSASANYYFPIAYPDWGLSGVFFLKRIYMSIGGDFARYRKADNYFNPQAYSWENIYSWGGTLRLDIAPLRMPSQSTSTVSLGLYVPSNGKLFFTAGFSVPL